jgi:hypothetical protein
MDARRDGEPAPMKNRTTVERKSERELVVTRTINGPARIVFEAWTKPELFKRWWVPKSMGVSLLSCEMDVVPGRVPSGVRQRSPDALPDAASPSSALDFTSGQRLKAWHLDSPGTEPRRRPRARQLRSVPVFDVMSPGPATPRQDVADGSEDHLHRVLYPDAAPPHLHFGEAEWRRKGLDGWCARCASPRPRVPWPEE